MPTSSQPASSEVEDTGKKNGAPNVAGENKIAEETQQQQQQDDPSLGTHISDVKDNSNHVQDDADVTAKEVPSLE